MNETMVETQLKQAIEKCNNDIAYFKEEIEKCQNKKKQLEEQLKALQNKPKGQRLLLPIHHTRITAGYKNSNYRKQFGFSHYGCDMTDKNLSDYSVYGMGNGKVLEAGKDSKTGWTLVIRYNDVILSDGTVKDIIIRMWHFDKLFIKKGDSITKDTLIANYGDTGTYASGKHLHIEADVDLQYPAYSPSFSGNTSIIKAGTDSTIHINKVLHVRTSGVNPQTIMGSTSSDCWVNTDVKYAEV